MASVKPRVFTRRVVNPLVNRLPSGGVETLTAAGEGELHGRGGTERFAAREAPVAERAAVIAAYPVVAGRTVEPRFRELPDPVDQPAFAVERMESST